MTSSLAAQTGKAPHAALIAHSPKITGGISPYGTSPAFFETQNRTRNGENCRGADGRTDCGPSPVGRWFKSGPHNHKITVFRLESGDFVLLATSFGGPDFLYTGVPRHSGHRPDVCAVFGGRRGEGVPQAVNSHFRLSRPLQHPVEHAAWGDETAGGGYGRRFSFSRMPPRPLRRLRAPGPFPAVS